MNIETINFINDLRMILRALSMTSSGLVKTDKLVSDYGFILCRHLEYLRRPKAEKQCNIHAGISSRKMCLGQDTRIREFTDRNEEARAY